MKIKSIEKLMRQTKNCTIIWDEENKTTWFFNGGVFVPLYDFPRIGIREGHLHTLLNIKDKEEEKWVLNEDPALPEGLCFDDYEPRTETRAVESDIVIKIGEIIVRAEKHRNGISFVSDNVMRIFESEDRDLDLYVRTAPNGYHYIAVKAGMLLRGIIFPIDAIANRMVSEELNVIADKITGMIGENDENDENDDDDNDES